ncbi:hypothetical protein DL98DRAFT_654096 [Cadophora sp. DSE1049]|nr:hypothetical protein DL98DRAFT_654096 [Cadophora sp. DSE1049]
MELDTPDRGGRRLGDFEATPNTPTIDFYKDINQLLRYSRRTPAKASPSTPPSDKPAEGEMATKDPEQPKVASENGKSNQAIESRSAQQDNTANKLPLITNNSSPSTAHTQPRIAKRPASPSIAQNGSSKRQQIRHNSPLMISPSRPLRNGPVDTLFGMGIDKDQRQMSSQRQQGPVAENSYPEGVLHQSGARSVNGDSEYRRLHSSRLASNQQTPSREHPSSYRQTPSREYTTPTRQTTSREHRSSQQQNQSPSYRYHTPQQHPPQTNHSPPQANMQMAEDHYRQPRATSVSSRRGVQHAHREIELEDHNMEDEDAFVSVAMARAASMMRESVRAQSQPPHRGSTVPPESFKNKPLYGQANATNGDRIMRATTPGQPRSVREIGSHNFNHDRINQNQFTPRPVSRHQTPRTPGTPAKFALDMLEDSDSSEDELEEKDMRSFFRRPNRNQPQQQPHSQSPYRRAQTAVPEAPQANSFPNRAKAPKPLQRQPEFEPYAVKQRPQLQSPIWASGADHLVSGSNSRSRTPFKLLDAYGFQEGRRGRSRSVAPRDVQDEQRGRSRSAAPRGLQGGQRGRSKSVAPLDFQAEQRGRSRSVAPRTPVIERVCGQSQYGSPLNIQTKSQVCEPEPRAITPSRPQTPSHRNNNVLNGGQGTTAITSSNSIQTPQKAPKTPNRAPEPKTPIQTPRNVDMLDDDSPATFHTPLDVLIRKNQQQPQPPPPVQNGNDKQEKVSSVLPSGSAFAKKAKPNEPKIESAPVTPKDRSTSGRGLAAPEVIDLITPEAPPRSIPMNERLTPAAKKPALKKTVAPPTNRAKIPKPAAAPPKRVAKEKSAPVDPEELRQKKIAEVIIERKLKSDEESYDLALFGELVRDQEADDKKAEEARAKGQRDREAKMAAMLAKEEVAKKAAAEEQAKKKEEAEKRKKQKELEEEQKKAKREADRQRQLAHENLEKEMLRKAAQAKIEAGREKKAKEEQQRELEKQKAKEKAESVQAEAEELAKMKAKQEQAKLQAASLNAAKLTPAVDPKPVEEPGVQMEDEDSLFMPEAPSVVPDKAKQDDRPGAKASNSKDATEVSSISAYRAEKEAEDLRKKLEQSQRCKEKLDTRYNRGPSAVAQNPLPAPRPRPSAPPPQLKAVSRPDTVVERSKPASQPDSEPEPESVVEKPKPTKPLPAKKDQPAPKPKAKSAPKSKTTREKIYESLQSRSSSSSAEVTPAPSYLDRLVATNIFKGMPKDFSSFGRTKSKPGGPKVREYKHQARLISDLEREELEKNKKRKGARVRDSRLTEEQKQKEAAKRTEKARERKAQAIREGAEKNGTQISEEDLNAQVEAFIEKRAQELQKRAENKARKEQDPGHDFGRHPLDAEALTPAQQLFRDTEANDGLSPEELQLRQKQRDDQAARAAYGKVRNNAFDRASARTTVNHFTDSEESEEDPDPEPEVESESVSEVNTQPQSTEDGDEEESSRDETSSESESEEEVRGMSPMPEMSDSFTAHVSEAELEAREKRLRVLERRLREPERMVMLYQVWKLEITREGMTDGEDKAEQQMVEQFGSLAEANIFASDLVNKFRAFQYIKLEESNKDGRYKASVAHDATHESQVFIVEMPVGPSELSPDFVAQIPKRFPEKFWDVMQFTSKRTVDEETGEAAVQHDMPERHGQFTALEMANHEACEKLIAMFKPAGANIDHIRAYQACAQVVREHKDQSNSNEECFKVEIEGDQILDWMGYDKISMVVEQIKLQGPLN